MNPRSTAILFVVALLLGAFVYFYEIEGEPDRREAEESSRRVFAGIEASDGLIGDLEQALKAAV